VPRLGGTVGSAIHSARAAVGVGKAGICAPLELGDRLLDSAGIAADDPVDERRRVIKILRLGQQGVIVFSCADLFTDYPDT
jgi:hypothetical protein